MTVQAIFRVLFRWWWLIVLGLAVGLVAGYQIQVVQGALLPGSLSTYSATATVTVGTETQGMEQTNTDLNLAESLVPTYVQLAQRPPITDRVVQALNLPISAENLASAHLEVVQPEKTQIIEITGKYPDPVTAAAIANETARQLQAVAPVRPTRLIQIVSLASVPSQSDAGVYLLIGVAAMAGLVLAIGLILVIEFALDRPYTPAWAASRLEMPILGQADGRRAPGRPGLFGLFGPRRDARRAPTDPVWWVVMATVDRLPVAEGQARGKTVVVTGAAATESKTATAVSLAHAAAASGRRTILIDADTQGSRLQRWFKFDRQAGVTSLAHNGYDGAEAGDLLVPGAIEGLYTLPLGPGTGDGPGRLLHDRFWQSLLSDLSQDADLVVVNAPEVRTSPEAMSLVRHSDGVLLTMDLGKSRAPQINAAQDTLEKAGARILGVVLD